jgi:hypothetical protein
MGWRDDPEVAPAAPAGPAPKWASDPIVAQPEVPGRALSFGRGAVQGATLNMGDEIEGIVQALGRKYLPESLGGGGEADARRSFSDLRQEGTAVARRENKEAEAAHPGYSLAGNLVGGAAPSILAGGSWAAAPAVSKAAKLQKAAKLGVMAAGLGGASGFGASEAPDAAGVASDSLKGAGLGLAFAAAAPAISAGAGKLLGAVKDGVVRLSPQAKLLLSKGADELTLGQRAPKSWINSIEQSAESIPILGDVIKGQRQAGREAWQRAVLAEARAPGAAAPASGNVGQRVDQILDGFHHAYDPIGKVPVKAIDAAGQPLGEAFKAAVSTPKVLAGDEARRATAGFLEDAHSALVNKVAGGLPLEASDLIGLRSAIRQEIRGALSGPQPDYKTARLLQGAEQAVTGSLQAQLPAAEAAALQATDAQYSKLMKVVDAVRRGGDQPGGFTPAQLSQAVKASAEKTGYAAGGGGELRQLAQAGRATLDATVPPTGARLLTMGLGTAALPVTTGVAALASTGFGKRLLTGTTRGQQFMSPYLEALIKGLRSGSQSPYVAGAVAEQSGPLSNLLPPHNSAQR